MEYLICFLRSLVGLSLLCAVGGMRHLSAVCDFPYPKHYTAYHLQEGERIKVDGRITEPAWNRVGWTDRFIDIQGANSTRPRFSTYAKMRWDDKYLYIGAYLQEPDVWAYQTKHDSIVFYDNDFEVFIDPDGSTHGYKEFEINAINTVWDLVLDKPYLNGGTPNSSWEMPSMKSAVYVDGPVNDPTRANRFWTVEVAMPFKDLIKFDERSSAPPQHGRQWRINFSRVEWQVKVVQGKYVKIPGLPEDNWVWSSQDAIDMHLPERWGFLEFSTDKVNTTRYRKIPNWRVYSTLIKVYNAEKKYFSVQGYYTSNLRQLELPSYILMGKCTFIPVVDTPNEYSFTVKVPSKDPTQPAGYIRDDRFIWYKWD